MEEKKETEYAVNMLLKMEEMRKKREMVEVLKTAAVAENIGYTDLALNIFAPKKEQKDDFFARIDAFVKANSEVITTALDSMFGYFPATKTVAVSWYEISDISFVDYKTKKGAENAYSKSEYRGALKRLAKDKFRFLESTMKKEEPIPNEPNKKISYSLEEFLAKYSVLFETNELLDWFMDYVSFSDRRYAEDVAAGELTETE